MTGDENPIYPELQQEIAMAGDPEPVPDHLNDFFFISPDISPRSFSGPAVIDNYDPSVKEEVQNTTPEVIEDYNPGADQETIK